MYNLCDYLIYQCVFFGFFSNNVGSYDPRSDFTIYDPTYLPRSYVGSQFWQLCSQVDLTILGEMEDLYYA